MGRIDDIVAELRARDAEQPPSAPKPNPSAHTKATRKRGKRSKPLTPRAEGDAQGSQPGRIAMLRKLAIASCLLAFIVFVVLPLIEKARGATAPVLQIVATSSPSASSVKTPAVDLNTTPKPSQWKGIIEQLDSSRARAFVTFGSSVATFDAAKGPAFTADTAALRALRRRKYRVSGVPIRVQSAVEDYVTQGQAPRASVTVTDTMGAYDVRSKTGALVRHVPARGLVTWKVVLTRNASTGWRYWSVTRVTPTSQ